MTIVTHKNVTTQSRKKTATTAQQISAASKALEDKKALDVVLIQLENKSTIADAIIIATGTSQRHVLTLLDTVEDALRKAGADIIGIEGTENGQWVLVDTGDIVVHIFQEDARQLYRLEKLWSHQFDMDDTDELMDALDITGS